MFVTLLIFGQSGLIPLLCYSVVSTHAACFLLRGYLGTTARACSFPISSLRVATFSVSEEISFTLKVVARGFSGFVSDC